MAGVGGGTVCGRVLPGGGGGTLDCKSEAGLGWSWGSWGTWPGWKSGANIGSIWSPVAGVSSERDWRDGGFNTELV